MTVQKRLAFQMRVSNGAHRVYLVRVNGQPVAAAVQREMFADRSASRAQLVCDALNNGLWNRVYLAVEAAVTAQQAAQAAARVEERQ